MSGNISTPDNPATAEDADLPYLVPAAEAQGLPGLVLEEKVAFG